MAGVSAVTTTGREPEAVRALRRSRPSNVSINGIHGVTRVTAINTAAAYRAKSLCHYRVKLLLARWYMSALQSGAELVTDLPV